MSENTKRSFDEDIVIKLHDIARLVESQIGYGTISHDLRKCADRVSDLLKPVYQGA